MTDLPALRELTLTRIRVMLREPEVIFWVFGFPVLLTLGLGVAFSDPSPEVLRVGVEAGSAGELYVEALDAHPELAASILAPAAAERAMARGEVAVLVSGDNAPVLSFDPTRPEGRSARLLTEGALQEAAGATRPLALQMEEVRQRGRRYIDWLLPGLIGFNLMSTGLWAVGFYVTQARENRQLKRLVATPMRRSDFLLAQVLARFLFLVLEIPLLVVFAWLVFDVRVEGSLVGLGAVVLLGAACFSGFGLLAASRTRTTEGVSGIINVILMPMLIFSGVFFSNARFPDATQPFIQALPLTALNDALRAIYNDGQSLAAVVPELLLLVGWTGLVFVLALRLFRWQ
jgi:ABC-2 type transport system permease protein